MCPVAPLKMFAIFNGLLIMFDYLLCVVLLFPAICLYDTWIQRRRNFFVSFSCCSSVESVERQAVDRVPDETVKPSFIRRILMKYYNILHFSRWPLVVLSVSAAITCGYYASKLRLPQTSDVRLLNSKYEYEKAYQWRLHLLVATLEKKAGSLGYVIWGTTPADTGNHNNPGRICFR
jgi:hypothetical protein